MAERDNERYIVALEIGSSKVRAAIGIVDNLGMVDVVAVEEDKIIDKVRYGCIQNVEVAAAASNVLERLQANPAIAPREITGVYVSLGGRSLVSSVAEVSVTMPGETEITDSVVKELCVKAAATVNADRDVVDVVPVSFAVDNKSVTNPVGTFGHVVSARLTVVSCNSQLKRMLRRVVTERLGLNICDYITLPLAQAAMVLSDDERRLGCMFVDFGAETTTVAIYRGGAPVYLTTLPMGSRNITLDLIALNYLEERAEEIKKVNGNALSPDPSRRAKGFAEGIDYTEVNNYIHARADEIAANIVAQIDYAGLTTANLPGGIVIVGGGARLRGFNELLQQQSKMQVRQGLPSGCVRITDGSIHGHEAVDVIAMLAQAVQLPESTCLTPLPEEPDDTTPESYESFEDENDPSASRIGRLDDDPDEETDRKKKAKKQEPTGKTANDEDRKPGGLPSLIGKLYDGIRRMTEDNSDQFQD